MIGSIIGDIVGSVYEFTPNNIKTKQFEFFNPNGSYTDDSILTLQQRTGFFMVARLHIIIVSMERNTHGRWVDMEGDSNFGSSAPSGNRIIDRTIVAETGQPCE